MNEAILPWFEYDIYYSLNKLFDGDIETFEFPLFLLFLLFYSFYSLYRIQYVSECYILCRYTLQTTPPPPLHNTTND